MRRVIDPKSARNLLRGLMTLSIIGPAILVFLAHGFLIRACTADHMRRRQRLIRNVGRYSRFALRVMRIRTAVSGHMAVKASDKNYLMVCNHLSYLDMMVLSAITPCVFVTSVDMGEVFFLGTMTEIGGSLYVERRHRDRLSHDISQLQLALAQGFNVMLFPEGTSSDGQGVLPFRRSLLTSAAQAGCAILPVTLKYDEIEGQAFDSSNSDIVCWYGSKAFVPHFLRLLSARSIHAVVKFHKPVELHDPQAKHVVADALHSTISNEYRSQGGEFHGVYQHG